jgi:anaerobic magnesium-protoporphyrin IX monomethyl ester cyclase
LVDLNLEFFDSVLKPDYLERACQRLRLDHQYLYPRAMLASLSDALTPEDQMLGMRFIAIESFLKEYGDILDSLPSRVMDALETLRDPRRFYNPDFLLDALFVLDRSLEVIALPYHPAELTLSSFSQPDCLMATEDLIAFTDPSQRDRNLFYDFMLAACEDILEAKPGYVGLSISAFSQIIPGLTLARMLKERAPEGCHINIGGNFFQRVKEVLLERPRFFEVFCHSLAVGEGEGPVLALVETLKSGGSLADVPDLLYPEHDKPIRSTAHRKPTPINETGHQDLADLPLDRYFTPSLVVCIRASKGCYWSKCTFCDTFYGVEKQRKSLDKLIGEVRHLRDQYGVRNFQFIDDCIPPSRARAIADRFLSEDLQINWFCNARLEKGYTPELMSHLKSSGLTMILWGFESGCPRILDLIGKGTDPEERYQTLRTSAEAGLWNFAYMFFGFPTETKAEARATIRALCDNRDIIHSYGRSVFTLGKHSLLNQQREKYGILEVVQDIEELSANLHYTAKTGMNDAEIDQMMKECTKTCAEVWGNALWFYLRYRENIHLYLARFGRDYVNDFHLKPAESAAMGVW